MRITVTGVLVLGLALASAAAASPYRGQERDFGARAGKVLLKARMRGTAVVFGHGVTDAPSAATPLVSLGELTVWRSHRGLEWREEGNRITFRSHDGAAKVTLDYRTGAVLSAGGLFSSWRGRRLQRLVVANGQGVFFGKARADFLVKQQWMSACFGDYARIDDFGLRLLTYPCFTGWDPRTRPYPDAMTGIVFSEVDMNVGGLRVQIAGHLAAYMRQGDVIGGVLKFKAILTNTGPTDRTVQPWRLAPRYGHSVLCLTDTATVYETFEHARAKWYHGRTTTGAGSAVSFALAPGDRVELSAASFAAFEETPDVVDKLGMVYWDGVRRIDFNLFARSRHGSEYPPAHNH